MSEQLTARPVPASLAGIVESLELSQLLIVTQERLATLSHNLNSHLEASAIAERLVRTGWLAPLRTRRAWEFIPASRAGRYRSGDSLIELRAHLAHRPEAPVAVGFESASWAHGFAGHQPHTPVVAHRRSWRVPQALDDLRTVTYEWVHPAENIDGLPVWSPPTIAVAAADRPDAQGDWGNADTWLPETMRATSPEQILIEATGRNTATLIRLAYLAEWSGHTDLVARLEERLPNRLPVTYLGPRQPRGRWIARWRLYDALLPQR